MKFLHISDLHIGKVVNDFSMLEDQRFILEQIQGMARENAVNAIIIAGDIYDRAIPPAEAVALFDGFLSGLHRMGICVLMISGNHDSPERISFGAGLLKEQGVHIAGVKRQELITVTVPEGENTLHKISSPSETQFVLMPFFKPAQVGARTTQEAVETVLKEYWQKEKEAGGDKRNRVLVTHFFVTSGGKEPELSDSETTIHVGGLDNVDVSLFKGFDYVALGHIHRPQQMGEEAVWYAGSPLKYSFGEVKQTKTAILVTLGEQGLEEVRQLPLRPLREMRKITGSLKEILEGAGTDNGGRQDYIQAHLTDKGELIDPIGTIRSVYPNVMQIVREEALGEREGGSSVTSVSGSLPEKKDGAELFADFYREVREEELSNEGKQIITDIIKEVEL